MVAVGEVAGGEGPQLTKTWWVIRGSRYGWLGRMSAGNVGAPTGRTDAGSRVLNRSAKGAASWAT